MKLISVIIPAYNDAHDLERTLDCLLEIRSSVYRELEIIVSLRDSSDGTNEIARRADTVVTGGKGTYARNAGAKVARGEILVFMDADATPAPDLFSRIGAITNENTIGSCSVFTDRPGLAPRITVWSINFARWSGIIKGVSSLMFCHRSLVHEKGIWFDEDLNLGELSDFIRRARAVGARFTYIPGRGYMIGTDRYEFWGYSRSMVFWLHWLLRSRVLGKPTDDLEKAYWSRKYGPPPLTKDEWRSVGASTASLFGVFLGILLTLSAYIGPRESVLYVFQSRMQEDPDTPIIDLLLYLAGSVGIDLLVGAALALVVIGLYVVHVHLAGVRSAAQKVIVRRSKEI